MTSEAAATSLGAGPTAAGTGATAGGTGARSGVTAGGAGAGTGVTAGGAGAAAGGAAATAVGAGATAVGAGATAVGADATVPEPVVAAVVSVPAGAIFGFVGLFTPVEVCGPDCGTEPTVLVAPPLGFFRGVSVTLPAELLAVALRLPEALVPSSACAEEPLEPGSATATAPPAPISRAATSTQTPTTQRKCDGTTICSPPATGPLVQHLPTLSQARHARSTVITHARVVLCLVLAATRV